MVPSHQQPKIIHFNLNTFAFINEGADVNLSLHDGKKLAYCICNGGKEHLLRFERSHTFEKILIWRTKKKKRKRSAQLSIDPIKHNYNDTISDALGDFYLEKRWLCLFSKNEKENNNCFIEEKVLVIWRKRWLFSRQCFLEIAVKN